MCFNNEDPEVQAPAPPPEVLKQAAPEKKTANKRTANNLAIGTKKYRNETGLGPSAAPVAPSGPRVSQ